MFNNYLITIGASAGGIEELTKLVSYLPKDFPGVILVVTHLPSYSNSWLPAILSKAGPLPVSNPIDGTLITGNKIFVAAPNKHMLVKDGVIHLNHGPKINYNRPAIDPLFRSAAAIYGSKVIGVILSGLLDDGVAGLLTIKRCGGTTIVQDPEEARFADMPRNALKYAAVDHCLPLKDIASLLIELVKGPIPSAISNSSPLHLSTENRMDTTANDILQDDIIQLGETSKFTCPECHGTLWEINDGSLPRFRCRVGHAFGLESLAANLMDNVEDALWAALRALEEKANLAHRIADKAINENSELAPRLSEKAHLTKQHAHLIRQILLGEAEAEIRDATKS